MKVAELLRKRRENWRELESLCTHLETRGRKSLPPPALIRFASLYRSACADLALADAYHLPANTIHYLHQLVGRAHNQFYRSRTFDFQAWAKELLFEAPQRLFRDKYLRFAFLLFWGAFLFSMFSAQVSPNFAKQLVGEETLVQTEEMYSSDLGRGLQEDFIMAGFYVNHNTGIGLQCFASGMLFGVGGIFTTLMNAFQIGAIFGHMAASPSRDNFFEFVTAHGPFELTAIVLSSAAGMRLGFSLVNTRGLSRMEAFKKAGQETLPTIFLGVLLFLLAAMVEGFISASPLPYAVKLSVAILSVALMTLYLVLLGYPREENSATR